MGNYTPKRKLERFSFNDFFLKLSALDFNIVNIIYVYICLQINCAAVSGREIKKKPNPNRF